MFERWLFERLLSRVHHYHLSIEGDDNPGAGGDAASEQEDKRADQGADAANGGDGDDVAAKAGTSLSALADDGASGAPADWPEDWRERLAGGNDAALRALKRYGGVEGLWKKLQNQEKLLSDRSQHRGPTLPEHATDEQIAEYRKAMGIPDAADGYGIEFSPQYPATDADKAMLAGWLEHAHTRNMTPAQAREAIAFVERWSTQAREEQVAAAQRERARISAELRREYGADHKRNLALADEFLTAHPGLAKLVNPNAPDLEVVRDIVSIARAAAPEDALYGGDGAAGGKSIDDRINELLDKSGARTMTKAESAELDKLYELRVARDSRRQTRAA